ncbi:MAG: class I SAM-dependent methyltransferase, partial [Actinomycetota bacterium]|nr:class I SAM-dependent methyltransferase [Actinomycetota bacterium]
MSALLYNKLCEIEDFTHPDLLPVLLEVCRHKLPHYSADFPRGAEHRKDWEVAMAARSLQAWGALHDDSVILGVAAGTEDTLFYLTRRARQVFATDRYLGAGEWQPVAPLAMLVEPSMVAPYDFDVSRLVVQHMDARALRYPSDFFDGIFSSGSIEHFNEFQDVANAAYEMGRVLKPGGVLTLSTEMQLSGPPGGIGWPGLTLLFSPANLQRYIIDASGLEPVDELRCEVSADTLETRRDLTQAIIDHDARVKALGSTDPFTDHSSWDFPHLVLLQGGYVFTSVQLTLRKTGSYPVVPNEWARPSAHTLEDIRQYNRALLNRPRGTGPAHGAPAPAGEPEAATDPLAGSWKEIEAAHRRRGEQLARLEHDLATRAATA